jgi:hypothetical protein
MKNLYLLALYISGFVVFFTFMEMIKIDDFILSLLENNNKQEGFLGDNNENKKIISNNERTILKTDDSSKPLSLSKEELGRHSWALLHSVASAMPSIPSEEDKLALENFLVSLAHVYPCKICGKHFSQMLKDYPIKHNSREEFAYYLCDLHNKVNVRLGKPVHDCKKTFDIWGGDCGCNVPE